MSENSVVDHFDTKSSEWDALYQRAAFKDRLNLFVSAVTESVPAGARILDYGCGSGKLSFALAEKGYSVTGVDISSGMIRSCQGRKAELYPESDVQFYVLEDASEVFEKGGFDAVVSSSVLEYIEDDEAVIGLFAAVLSPGGRLFFSVPHTGSLTGWFEDQVVSRIRKKRDVAFCQRRYELNDLTALLEKKQFNSILLKHFEFPRFGSFGVFISRVKQLGLLTIISCQKK